MSASFYWFFFGSGISSESGRAILDAYGVEVYCCTEEPKLNKVSILGVVLDSDSLRNLPPEIIRYEQMNHQIDWKAQWEMNTGELSEEGVFSVEWKRLGIFSQTGVAFVMKPGPGFGDLSHSTTKLMIRFMKELVPGKNVIDIGCGSGVLSLCSSVFGAEKIFGIDIDPEAIVHAKENVDQNRFQNIWIGDAEGFKEIKGKKLDVFLMNMILSEQREAWMSLPYLHQLPLEGIISGILEQERNLFIEQIKEWNFEILEEDQDKEWLGFRVTKTTD